MKKVAPELDGLMWTLAEDGNDRAIDEFGTRNPELRSELLRRIEIVKGLRGAGKTPSRPMASIPRFVPTEPRGSVFQTKPGRIVAGLALAAIAAIAFAVTILITPPTHPRAQDPIPPKDAPKPHPQAPARAAPLPTAPPVVSDTTPPPVDQPHPDVHIDESATMRKASLHVDHATLLNVLKLIGANCGVSIVPGPGMPNPTVEADYQGMSAMGMLHDLGQKYAFTAFDQHDGTILVVPAVDTGDHPEGSVRDDPKGNQSGRKIGG